MQANTYIFLIMLPDNLVFLSPRCKFVVNFIKPGGKVIWLNNSTFKNYVFPTYPNCKLHIRMTKQL